jgi:hypothetical protein
LAYPADVGGNHLNPYRLLDNERLSNYYLKVYAGLVKQSLEAEQDDESDSRGMRRRRRRRWRRQRDGDSDDDDDGEDKTSREVAAIRFAAYHGHSTVVELLLQSGRVDADALHKLALSTWQAHDYPSSQLTDAMLPHLATLSLPFPHYSGIVLWQSRLHEYRQERIAFLEGLIDNWRWHGGGLCHDVVDHIVSEYLLGMKLRDYCAMNAGYVAPVKDRKQEEEEKQEERARQERENDVVVDVMPSADTLSSSSSSSSLSAGGDGGSGDDGSGSGSSRGKTKSNKKKSKSKKKKSTKKGEVGAADV